MTIMLLEWVITSVFLILTVLALRAAFGKRVSARLRYAMWAVVLVRLLVPVQLFTSPLAGTRFFSENRTEQTVTQWPITSDAHATAKPDDVLSLDLPNEPLTHFPAAPQAPQPPTVPIAPEAPAAPDLTRLPVWLGWIWLGGSAALALVLAASNLRFSLRLRRSRIPLDGTDCPLPVYETVGLPSPCLFGLARPAVYVTPDAAADPAMLRHVLTHEYTHFRQGDHLWSFLRCAALAAHWWNPLVWLAVTLSRRDGELSCDEGALKRLGDSERLAYGNTLLALVTAKPGPGDLLCFATTMAGEKKSLKERVSRIAHAPKRWLWAAVAVVLATALACACAFGSAREPDQADESDPTSSAAADPEPALDSWVSGNTKTLTVTTDLNRNGVPETVNIVELNGVAGQRLELWEDGEVIFTENAFFAHAGYNAMFLCTLNGKDYLLRYNPYMGQGWCNYSYELFTLTQDGKEKVAQKNSIGFDINFGLMHESFDPEAIAAFMDEINGLLAHSVQLINTDPELLDTFRKEGRLYDSLSWLDLWAPVFVRDETASLLENLTRYKLLAERSEFTVDLNRNGVPEYVHTVDLDGRGQRLEIWEGDELIFSEEGFYAHAGENAVFLCTLDGKSFLLRYNPYMSQGFCDYSYQLFTLENGMETAVQENHVAFDINFGMPIHVGFDPESIAAFMDEVNGLLAHSVQLINTNDGLLASFQEEGRLYDGRWWLNPSMSMLESLKVYKASMEASFQSVLLGKSQFMLFQDEAGYLLSIDDIPAMIYPNDPYVKFWDFTVVDMDGYGRDEVLVRAYGISGDSLGYLLLRQENGMICGTVFNARNNWSNRWFYNLKADGTFFCFDSADSWESVSKLFFTVGGGTGIYGLTVIRNNPSYDLERFMTIQKEVTQEEDWLAAIQAQSEKPNAVWYEFNAENINAVL